MLNGAIARFDAYLIEGVEIREVRGKKTCINHFKSNPHNVHLYSIWARFTDHKGNPKFVDRRGEVITAEIFMQKSMFELRLSTEENFKAHSGMMAGDIRYQSPKFYRQLYDPRSKVQNKELVAEKFCLAFNNFRKKAPDKVEEYRWTLPAFTNGSPSHWVSTLNKIKSRLNPESRSIVNPNPLANTNVSNGPSSNVHEITMEPIEEIEIQLTPVELITQSPD